MFLPETSSLFHGFLGFTSLLSSTPVAWFIRDTCGVIGILSTKPALRQRFFSCGFTLSAASATVTNQRTTASQQMAPLLPQAYQELPGEVYKKLGQSGGPNSSFTWTRKFGHETLRHATNPRTRNYTLSTGRSRRPRHH